jgi:hypothetical protein
LIIAIKDKDKVVMACTNTDSLDGLTDADYVDEENIAIKFSKSGKLFGFADMNRRSDMLLYDDVFMGLEINAKTIIKDVIPYIKCELKENNKPIDENGNWQNALIICDNERIYDIDPTFGFYEADDYVCHGYRVETIKSVLDATTNLSAEERIMKVVSFASKLHKEDLFPLIITDTKTKQFKYIYKGEDIGEHSSSL